MPNYYKILPATITSGSQASSAIKINGQQGISIEIPTFTVGLNTAAASVSLTGCDTLTGTYRPIFAYSAASGFNALTVLSSHAGNVTVMLGCNAKYLPQFIKVNVSGTNATATAAGFGTLVHMYA